MSDGRPYRARLLALRQHALLVAALLAALLGVFLVSAAFTWVLAVLG